MSIRLLPFALLSLALAGCNLCWPRGGAPTTCDAADDDAGDDDAGDDDAGDDDAGDDDAGDDDAGDDDAGDDDDVGDDDTAPPFTCSHGDTVAGPTFTGPFGPETYDLRCVAPGTFLMGTPPGHPDKQADEAQHEVTLTRGLLAGQWEIPIGLYEDVTGADPSNCPICSSLHPVISVSWTAATNFANTLSLQEGLEPVYVTLGRNLLQDLDADGYRLPTEAEWEYLAWGGEAFDYAGSDDPDDTAWCDVWGADEPNAVGLKQANGYGLYDMSGNVAEWVWDYYEATYPTGPVTDPTGPTTANFKVRRGGNYFDPCDWARPSSRSYDTLGPSEYRGFRLVRTVAIQ